ncbi:MAG: carboxymuconolactone decarboxylase family protein [Hyphomicrobiales bacterium]
MHPRMDISELIPDIYKAIGVLNTSVKKSGIDPRYLHLAKLRASQINGCAYCVDLHVKEATAHGLDSQMLHLIATWPESSFFDDRDRAVLKWTESITLAAQTGIPDNDYEAIAAVFSPTEVAQLTVAIAMMNMLNRIGVGSRMQHPIS